MSNRLDLPPVVVGFTGTRVGMSPRQRHELWELLELLSPAEAHHGDCIGADAQFHDLCRLQGVPKVVLHPVSLDWNSRAFCEGDVTLPPKPPLVRNQDIVEACTHLIAAPKRPTEQRRSGTWSTTRRTTAAGRVVHLLLP